METSTNNYIYRLTLVVAVPDNADGYGASSASAVDQVLEAISYTGIFVLSASSQQLEVTDKPTVIVSDEAKHLLGLVHKQIAKPVRSKATKRKVAAGATSSYKRWTDDEKLYVIGLADDGVLHAEIARLVHRSTSAVYNVVWLFNKKAKK